MLQPQSSHQGEKRRHQSAHSGFVFDFLCQLKDDEPDDGECVTAQSWVADSLVAGGACQESGGIFSWHGRLDSDEAAFA